MDSNRKHARAGAMVVCGVALGLAVAVTSGWKSRFEVAPHFRLVPTPRSPVGDGPSAVESPLARDGAPTTAATDAATRIAADVGEVIRRSHFAFVAERGDLVAGTRHFERRLRPNGELELTARVGEGRDRKIARLDLGRTRMQRGGEAVSLGPERTVDPLGHVVSVGGSVVETLANDERGLEQSWTLDRAPRGDGPLEVRIATAGAAHVATTASGVHFAARGDTLGFVYGHVTVIEADGNRHSVAARYDQGLVFEVPAAVLDSADYPLVIDPVIGAEVAVDAAAPGDELAGTSEPAVTWNGSEFLVVWADTRSVGAGPGIYGARLSAAGAVLDVGGFPIATSTTATFSAPAVASNLPDYLVTWRSTTTATGHQRVLAARVSSARVVLDASPLLISASGFPTTISDPLVASLGASYGYLVAWNRRTARIGSNGSVLEYGGYGGDGGTPYTGLAATSGGYIWYQLAYANGNGVGTSVVAWDGTRPNDSGTAAPNAVYAPSVACRLNTCVAAWTEDRTATPDPASRYVMYWTLSGAKGYVQATAGAYAHASITMFGASRWYVTYSANATTTPVPRGAYIEPTSPSVWVGPTETLATTASAARPARLVSNGNGIVVFPFATPRFVRASGDGSAPAGPFAAAVRSSDQWLPAVAGNSDRYLVAWHDERVPTGIYAIRAATSGTVADTASLFVAGTSATPQRPAVATDGVDFAVAYDSGGGHLRRIDGASGLVLDATGVPLGVGARPSIASSTSEYLVVGDDGTTVRGRLVSHGGVVQGALAFTVASGTNAAVASNGTTYQAAFETAGDIGGVLLDAAGTSMGNVVVSAASGVQSAPSVASDGTDYLVAWSDLRSGIADIYGVRTQGAAAGVTGSEFAISSALGAQTSPALSFDQSDFLAVWTDARAGSTDLFGTRISPLGFVEDDALGTALAALPTVSEGQPSVASAVAGTHLVAYAYSDPAEPHLGASRIRSRAVAYGSLQGSICTVGTDCDTGFCVDGVCCENACGGGASTDCLGCVNRLTGQADGVCATVAFFAASACRAAVGPCDAVEYCNGSGPTCPGDTVKAAGQVCRPAESGSCDVAETCTGFSTECPTDAVLPTGAVCRSSRGPCDVEETCDGLVATCPSDAVQPTGYACRPSGGVCDQEEVCDGTGAQCPGDVRLPNGTPCRVAVGVCDVTESCNGAAECPPDGFAGNTTPCDTAHGECDFPDFCTGASAVCPELVVADGTPCDDDLGCTSGDACAAGLCSGIRDAAGTVCRAAAGGCDVVETCDGSSDACPADTVRPVDFECRASVGSCDSPEVCDGSSVACPGDVRFPAGTTCRSAAGACDLEEQCTGTSATCPADAFKPVGSICRAAVTACDASEFCGGGPSCPTDDPVADGTPCDDGLACTTISSCRIGACQPSLTIDCSDGNPCTTDVCVEPTGCSHAPVPACSIDAGADSGAPADLGVDAATVPVPNDGGCSCSVHAQTGPPPLWTRMLGLAGGLAWLARRRRGRFAQRA